jgi:hypothetical protein
MSALRPRSLHAGRPRAIPAEARAGRERRERVEVGGAKRRKTACRGVGPRCRALPLPVAACPLANLGDGPGRPRGAPLILRAFAGAEGKDDRAP